MASVDSYNNIFPLTVLAPKVYTAAVNIGPTGATGSNLQGYESATWVIQTGVITDGTWKLLFQSSNTGTTGTWSSLNVESTGAIIVGATGESQQVPVLLCQNQGATGAMAVTAASSFVPGPFVSTDGYWNDQCFRVGYVGQKQFVRMLLESSGVTTGGLFSANLELGCAHFAPTPPNLTYA